MLQQILRFVFYWFAREDGQDLLEYGLLTLFISLAAIGLIPGIGDYVLGMYTWIVSGIP